MWESLLLDYKGHRIIYTNQIKGSFVTLDWSWIWYAGVEHSLLTITRHWPHLLTIHITLPPPIRAQHSVTWPALTNHRWDESVRTWIWSAMMVMVSSCLHSIIISSDKDHSDRQSDNDDRKICFIPWRNYLKLLEVAYWLQCSLNKFFTARSLRCANCLIFCKVFLSNEKINIPRRRNSLELQTTIFV